MSGAEHVILRLISSQKTADASVLLYRRQCIATPSQNLVRVSLVSNVPNQPIARRVKRVVQRYRQLDRAERGAGMTTNTRHRFQYVLPDFVGYRFQFLNGQSTQICG